MKDREKNDGLPVAALAIIVAIVIVALYSVDRFLESLERREIDAQARHLYEKGEAMLAQHRAQEAASLFESAHVLQRTNRNYLVALASAQIAGAKPEQAKVTLADLLERKPNDAEASLLMAQVMVAEHRFDEAGAYYHRAIYGTWAEHIVENQLRARLELAQMLARRGRREELLSEVLFLRESARKDPALEAQVAALFLEAGSASRAEELYHDLVSRNPRDSSAYAGLGEAELILGNYRLAETAFTEAAALDRGSRTRAELARTLEALDPTPRRLKSAEKFQRSSEILRLTEESVAPCLAGKDPDSSLQPLFERVEQLLAERRKPPFSNELSEERLDAAEKLWTARSRICGNPLPSDDPIGLVMKKLIPSGPPPASATTAM